MSDWTEASVREASKIEWLEKQPDKFKDTPQGRTTFQILKGMVERNPKADGVAPWIWREAKKGRLVARNYGDQSYFIYNEQQQPGGLILNSSGLSHLADWFHSGNQNPTRRGVDIMQLTADDMESKLGEWDEHLRSKQEQADQEKLKGGDVVHQYPDGWTLRNLKPGDLDAEGDAMGHCVGGYGYQDMVNRGDRMIYSLRDPQHQPHATMELEPTRTRSPGGQLLDGTWTGAPGEFSPAHENALIHQIQGKGNEVPKPEYQQRLKQFFETMPPEQRPTWAESRSAIDHIGQITGEDENGDVYQDEDGDMGGYGEHGDYGLNEGRVLPTQYDSVLDSIHHRAQDRGNRWGRDAYHDVEDTRALYNHALKRQEIPQLAAATDRYREQTEMPSLMELEDMNHEWLDYPGEAYEEEPERWESPDHFKDAYEQYQNNRNALEASHTPSQITSDLYANLNKHWQLGPPGEEWKGSYGNEPNALAGQQTFSHVPEQHLHREPDWTGFSAVDYLEDNRYRKRAIS